MDQKHFMDIDRAKFSTELRNGNTDGFEVGDHIVIQEKWDGSCASIQYDIETGKLITFSRKQELNYNNTLAGFWNYVQQLNPEDFKNTPNLVIFGEWGRKNKINYNQDSYGKWYVFDIYDRETQKYLPQDFVKQFTEDHGLTYIHTLYDGPFISWDHCKSFCHSPAYGDMQEGVVVKNMTKLNTTYSKLPFVLKIVNEDFAEVKSEKVVDPQKLAAQEKAKAIVDMIVTKRRVEKEILKMRDEGILPEKIEPKDMKIVAQNLPKRIYDDCLKEEREYVIDAGEYFGKTCGATAMKLAKEIILGG